MPKTPIRSDFQSNGTNNWGKMQQNTLYIVSQKPNTTLTEHFFYRNRQS